MDQKKPNFSIKTALSCALLLITLCVLLVGTVTFARYRWEFAQATYPFVPEAQRGITVYKGTLTAELIAGGRLPQAVDLWEETNGGAVLPFAVANGTPETFALDDRQFGISILAGLTVEDPEQLTVSLSYTDENGRTVTAAGVPEQIVAGSMQQNAFGDGWIYRFYDGEETLQFSLAGNAFSYENFTVTVTGNVPATLLELQVTQLNG